MAPGSDRIPVELFQILTQYAMCRLPAYTSLDTLESVRRTLSSSPVPQEVQCAVELVNGDFSLGRWENISELLTSLVCRTLL